MHHPLFIQLGNKGFLQVKICRYIFLSRDRNKIAKHRLAALLCNHAALNYVSLRFTLS